MVSLYLNELRRHSMCKCYSLNRRWGTDPQYPPFKGHHHGRGQRCSSPLLHTSRMLWLAEATACYLFCWSLANSSNICWAGGGGDMGYLIGVTDVKVTSACNKERRDKIKLSREASLNPPKKSIWKRREKNNHEPWPSSQKSTCREDHEFLAQQLPE